MTLTRMVLAKEVDKLFDFPTKRHFEEGKAMAIVQAVIKVMTEALRNRERIRIDGLGTFKVRRRKAHRIAPNVFYRGRRLPTRFHMIIPAKWEVTFTPQSDIIRSLNEP